VARQRHEHIRDAFIYRRNKFTQKANAFQPEFTLVPVPFGSIPETDPVPGAPLHLLIGERFRIEVSDEFSASVLTKLVLTFGERTGCNVVLSRKELTLENAG
jgi:hypothetical protein